MENHERIEATADGHPSRCLECGGPVRFQRWNCNSGECDSAKSITLYEEWRAGRRDFPRRKPEPKKCGCGVVLPEDMKLCVDCEPCLLAPDGKKWGVDCDHSPHFFKNGMQQPCEHADCAFGAPPKKASSVCKCYAGTCSNGGPHRCANCGEMCPGNQRASSVPDYFTSAMKFTVTPSVSTPAVPRCNWKTQVNPGSTAYNLCGHRVAHDRINLCEEHIFQAMNTRRAGSAATEQLKTLPQFSLPGTNPPQPIAYRTRTVK